MRVDDAQRNHNFLFEVAFAKLLRQSSAHRVLDPRAADFFFVPVEAASYFYLDYVAGNGSLAEADGRVARSLRAAGPFWDGQRRRHVVPSLRCPESAPRRQALPELWGGGALQLCLHAARPGVDLRRSLHVGYYVPGLAEAAPAPARHRDLLAVYVGFPVNRYRSAVASWMQRRGDCAAFVLGEHSNASGGLIQAYHAALPRAYFAIEPPGDTLERMSRDAGVLGGAVPVIFDFPPGMQQQVLPWAPVLDWSQFSVNFTLEPMEVAGMSDFVPRLERLLRSLVRSGEADRLHAGLARARARLTWNEEGVLATVMEMLARRKFE